MKTAVQQLIHDMRNIDMSIFNDEHCKKYLEMEKQQIINAGNSCAMKSTLHRHNIDQMTLNEIQEHLKNDLPTTFGEEYYNETYAK